MGKLTKQKKIIEMHNFRHQTHLRSTFAKQTETLDENLYFKSAEKKIVTRIYI